MSLDPFEHVPSAVRDSVRAACAETFGAEPVERLQPVPGGSSGAVLLRATLGGRAYLVRAEGPESALLRRNPHRHVCTRLTADAGIAPRLHVMDEAAGVFVTDFIEAKPLASFPGGAPALARALGELLARLQGEVRFPRLVYYPDLLTRMLEQVSGAGLFAPGLLDPHRERLAKLRADYDWNATAEVASHNDPNPGKILFDGERLWLIDWEAGYRNDPLVDISIVLDSLAPSPELETTLLSAWLGRAPDRATYERLRQVRPLTRLYYACFLLNAAGPLPEGPDPDIAAPSSAAVGRAITELTIPGKARDAARTLGKAYLAGFLGGAPVSAIGQGLGRGGD